MFFSPFHDGRKEEVVRLLAPVPTQPIRTSLPLERPSPHRNCTCNWRSKKSKPKVKKIKKNRSWDFFLPYLSVNRILSRISAAAKNPSISASGGLIRPTLGFDVVPNASISIICASSLPLHTYTTNPNWSLKKPSQQQQQQQQKNQTPKYKKTKIKMGDENGNEKRKEKPTTSL